MLTIVVDEAEAWDENKQEFIYLKKAQTLRLEHSLVSLSKWESKWHKPFLGKNEKTEEETLDYIRCMTITQNIPAITYMFLSNKQISEITKYIENPMTATSFREEKKRGNSRVITSELIYYWMVAAQIPFECEKWHLNRLMTLIRVCEVENRDPKKMNQREIMKRNRELNEAQKKRFRTKG